MWVTMLIPVDLFTTFIRNLGPHFSPFHNGLMTFFLLITREWVTSVDNFRKASLFFLPLLIFEQGSLRWMATGLSKVTSGGGVSGMCRMCILKMLRRGSCPLLGFYPFPLVWLLQ